MSNTDFEHSTDQSLNEITMIDIKYCYHCNFNHCTLIVKLFFYFIFNRFFEF